MSRNDFSKAPSGGGSRAEERSFDEVSKLLMGRALAVYQHLVPGGRVNGDEYAAGSLDGGRGRSFSGNIRTGVWKDFATGESGADLINLFAIKGGVDQLGGKHLAEEWLGLDRPGSPKSAPPWAAGAAPATQAPSHEEEEDDQLWWRSIRHESRWDYKDAQGGVVASVYRFRHPISGKKLIRPWDPESKRWEHLKGKRPLLYLPEILSSAGEIVVVEGEKCADAIRATGRLGTTILGGAQAIGAADLSPLAGRHVVLWRDNDSAGLDWQNKMANALREVGVASVRDVTVPVGKPEKWDCADAPETERKALLDTALKAKPIVTGKERVRLADHDIRGLFRGKAPQQEYLVQDLFPRAVGGLVVAPGSTGKGMMLLDLGLKVACGKPDPVLHPTSFGASIARFGAVVILFAEDNRDEVHRRLERLDPRGDIRGKQHHPLITLTMPNLGGASPLFKQGRDGLITTDWYADLRDQMISMNDLALVVIDPISNFALVDMDASNDACTFVGNTISELAQATGATVLLAHHPRKGEIKSLDNARDAIRGGGGIVNSLRFAYVMWAALEPEAKDVLKAHGREVDGTKWRNQVFRGALVKGNGMVEDLGERLYVKDATGTPIDRTMPIKIDNAERILSLLDLLEGDIRRCALDGHPFKMTGVSGLHENPAWLSPQLRGVPRKRLREMANELEAAGRIAKCLHTGRAHDTLDVPGGPFHASQGIYLAGGATPAKSEE